MVGVLGAATAASASSESESKSCATVDEPGPPVEAVPPPRSPKASTVGCCSVGSGSSTGCTASRSIWYFRVGAGGVALAWAWSSGEKSGRGGGSVGSCPPPSRRLIRCMAQPNSGRLRAPSPSRSDNTQIFARSALGRPDRDRSTLAWCPVTVPVVGSAARAKASANAASSFSLTGDTDSTAVAGDAVAGDAVAGDAVAGDAVAEGGVADARKAAASAVQVKESGSLPEPAPLASVRSAARKSASILSVVRVASSGSVVVAKVHRAARTRFSWCACEQRRTRAGWSSGTCGVPFVHALVKNDSRSDRLIGNGEVGADSTIPRETRALERGEPASATPAPTCVPPAAADARKMARKMVGNAVTATLAALL
mmetsp:Transcript_7641/g.24475  ORF Transcript_7641/g.24475 Transcript_7641/m.24475 type:complete len:369 (-) Transcript_7641:272-1378(-)